MKLHNHFTYERNKDLIMLNLSADTCAGRKRTCGQYASLMLSALARVYIIHYTMILLSTLVTYAARMCERLVRSVN